MILAAAIVGILGIAGLSPAVAQATNPSANPSSNAVAVQAKQAALKAWHQSIRHMAPPTVGCFHASYPSMIWEKVACGKAAIPHSVPSQKAIRDLLSGAGQPSRQANQDLLSGNGQLGLLGVNLGAGAGNGYVAQTASPTQSAVGSFPSVTNVTSVSSSGSTQDSMFNGQNHYTLQLNTNLANNGGICKDAPPGTGVCRVWEQFSYQSSGDFAVLLIENWALGWGVSAQAAKSAKSAMSEQPSSASASSVPSILSSPLLLPTSCPDAGWTKEPLACEKSVKTVNVPVIPISSLANASLIAMAAPNGNDEVMLVYGQDVYSLVEPDSTLDISSVWNQSEFNVLGDAGGALASFNPGASITVNLQVNDGTGSAPTCLGPSGVSNTQESNNLTLGKCTASGATAGALFPYIQFTESD